MRSPTWNILHKFADDDDDTPVELSILQNNIATLFADLEITTISVDDFICMIAILPSYRSTNDTKHYIYKWSLRKIIQHWNAKQHSILTEIATHITNIQSNNQQCIPLCNCIDTNTSCQICKDDYYNYDDNNHIIVNNLYTDINMIIAKYKSETCMSTMRDTYLSDNGIQNFITICDKLNLTSQINCILNHMHITLPSPTTIINHTCSFETIVKRHINNYNLLFNNSYAYDDKHYYDKLYPIITQQHICITNLRYNKNLTYEDMIFEFDQTHFPNLKTLNTNVRVSLNL